MGIIKCFWFPYTTTPGNGVPLTPKPVTLYNGGCGVSSITASVSASRKRDEVKTYKTSRFFPPKATPVNGFVGNEAITSAVNALENDKSKYQSFCKTGGNSHCTVFL